jgi:Mg2+/Co2+ transporter CorB
MVWVVSDEAMEQILGGDFTDVVVLHESADDVSVRTLYRVQDTYKSYQGFRKFFRKHLEPIIERISFIEDNTFMGKVVKYFTGM